MERYGIWYGIWFCICYCNVNGTVWYMAAVFKLYFYCTTLENNQILAYHMQLKSDKKKAAGGHEVPLQLKKTSYRHTVRYRYGY